MTTTLLQTISYYSPQETTNTVKGNSIMNEFSITYDTLLYVFPVQYLWAFTGYQPDHLSKMNYSDCQCNFVDAAKIYILMSLQLPWEQRISACRKSKSHYAEGDFNWI